jgi:hypothetical protein
MDNTKYAKVGIGVWSEEESRVCNIALGEIFDAMPKSKKAYFIDYFNKIACFLAEAGRRAKLG